MGSDNDSINSCDQDYLMVKTNMDTICPNDDILDSGGHFGKNCTKKSIYDTYTALSTEVVPINLPFSTKDIICSFEMNNGVEVADDDVPVDLLKITGKKKYFLQANDVLITKLDSINKKHKKKIQERKDYTIMPVQGNKEEFVVHPRKLKMRDCNIPERFYVLTK